MANVLSGFDYVFWLIVLLGHYHYSIDVLAALFITHGLFQISRWLFGRDYALFRSSESESAQRPKGAGTPAGKRSTNGSTYTVGSGRLCYCRQAGPTAKPVGRASCASIGSQRLAEPAIRIAL